MFNLAFWVWVAVFIIALILELVTVSLVSIWVCLGSIVAIIANLLGFNEVIQIILFTLVTVISFLALYNLAKTKLLNPKNRLKSNVEKYVGQRAICTQDIDNVLGTGEVISNGIYWSAKSTIDDLKISKDTPVIIDRVEGSKLIVKVSE
jgi:membrane protein implicated in regulation of membrane protease activity